MDTDTCEGFANYATFSVAVVVDNDQAAHEHARAFVWECDETTAVPGGLGSEGGARWLRATVGDRLRDYFEQSMPELDGFWSGILRAGWGLVDWSELVDHFRDAEWREAQS